ncbi:TPR-like protein [Trametes coccinea BRFM310]|uniref:TPR-like protein n=1 Tax=Trametes coccinea (strain BRFM310) TaxID=1353009 RepID=A0A1Y2IZR6_TRAC3|nr:TPR-like protein [Trametes coccinea BRFM310]
MSSDDETKAKVEQLKAEGNELHSKGNYAAARLKYSEAIKLHGENAILYANRAAAYIAQRQYLDAAKDAQRAVEIDPAYSKAWARLAKSTFELRVWRPSINAWKKALETLPSADLTAQQQQLKQQYEEGLKQAEAELQKNESKTMEQHNLRSIPADQRPWIRALAMEDVLTSNAVLNTSAWVIMNAYKDFSEGVRYMKEIKKTDTGIHGNMNALQLIINGLLRDDRVFHMDSEDWLDKLQLQVQFEVTANEGWAEGGPETVKEEAVKRLKEKGWKAIRGALGATIRAWFLRAYFAHRSGSSISLALQSYNNILDVLDWGSRTWHDVPTSDRGVIFQKTYIRAIRRLKMDAYLGALKEAEVDSEYNVEDLMELANQIVDETTKNAPKEGDNDEGPLDKGAWYSFYVYPVADAHATLGAIFMQQGLSAKQAGDKAEMESMLAAASKFYKKAAEMYPPDDENFALYLKVAFEAEYHLGKPLSETLPLCKRIRDSLPGILKIWEMSPSDKLTRHIPDIDRFEQRAYTGLLEKKYTLETPSSEVRLN